MPYRQTSCAVAFDDNNIKMMPTIRIIFTMEGLLPPPAK
jgi:hypothetical protein